MMTIRSKTLFLCACFAEALWLLLAQTVGSTSLLIPCLICFLALVAWAASKNMAMPVILFFLPFVALLKIRPGAFSFFTIALLIVYMMYVINNNRNTPILHFIPALCLIGLTMAVKTVYDYEIENSYILFVVTLMLIPFLARELEGENKFYWLTLFFSAGIILAATTAQYLTAFPTIARYVDVSTLLGVVRQSGYYGDPNFYSAHITAALAGVLILILNNDKKRRLVPLFLLVLILVYCGLLSISKSFLLVCLAMFIIWFADLLFRRGAMTLKLSLVLIVLVAVIFFLSSTLFTDLLDEVIGRFSQDNNMSDFTTGRTDLWSKYLTSITEDFGLLLFGQGCSNVMIDGRVPHNTLIQSLFQLGVFGCVLMFGWAICFLRTMLADTKIRWNNIPQVMLLLISIFGPWMALDYLFMSEFFLLPVYMCAALRFLSDCNEIKSPLLIH